MKLYHPARSGLLFSALFLLSSCAPALIVGGAAVGAGVTAYVSGELRATDSVSIDRAWSASQRAMTAMEFRIVESEKDAVEGRLVATGAKDKKITVNLRSTKTAETEIRIRVDVFGDEALSERILREIRARY